MTLMSLGGEKLGMGHGVEQSHIQPFVASGPIAALNVRVLSRLVRLDIGDLNVLFAAPNYE